MDKHTSSDDRIVYGARCFWWDGIEKAGNLRGPSGISLPCCPHCGGVLFEILSPAEWWKGVEKFEADGHPGYRAFVEWAKGKCFPSITMAKVEYEKKPGRTVTIT